MSDPIGTQNLIRSQGEQISETPVLDVRESHVRTIATLFSKSSSSSPLFKFSVEYPLECSLDFVDNIFGLYAI